MTTPLLIVASTLGWWQLGANFVIALLLGVIIANFIYRDYSWHCLLTSKYKMHWWTAYRNFYSNSFENYASIIFFITLLGWMLLNVLVKRLV